MKYTALDCFCRYCPSVDLNLCSTMTFHMVYRWKRLAEDTVFILTGRYLPAPMALWLVHIMNGQFSNNYKTTKAPFLARQLEMQGWALSGLFTVVQYSFLSVRIKSEHLEEKEVRKTNEPKETDVSKELGRNLSNDSSS